MTGFGLFCGATLLIALMRILQKWYLLKTIERAESDFSFVSTMSTAALLCSEATIWVVITLCWTFSWPADVSQLVFSPWLLLLIAFEAVAYFKMVHPRISRVYEMDKELRADPWIT